MRLYRTANGLVVGTQDEARKDGRGWGKLDVPTTKAELIDWLNENLPGAVIESPAFVLGRSDAERGITTNPFSSMDLRTDWERGHAHAVELGLAKLPSFAARTRGVSRFNAKRPRKTPERIAA